MYLFITKKGIRKISEVQTIISIAFIIIYQFILRIAAAKLHVIRKISVRNYVG